MNQQRLDSDILAQPRLRACLLITCCWLCDMLNSKSGFSSKAPTKTDLGKSPSITRLKGTLQYAVPMGSLILSITLLSCFFHQP